PPPGSAAGKVAPKVADPLPKTALNLQGDGARPIVVQSVQPQGPVKAQVSAAGKADLLIPIGFKGTIPMIVTTEGPNGTSVKQTIEVAVEGPKPAVTPVRAAIDRPRLRPDKPGKATVIALDERVAISWKADAGQKAYGIYRGDELVCLTVYSSCIVPAVNGELSNYTVVGIDAAGAEQRLARGSGAADPDGTLILTVYFDSTEDALKSKAQSDLSKLKNDMLALGLRDTFIAGHTDTLGPVAYNAKLSKARAEKVRKNINGEVFDAQIDERARGEKGLAVSEANKPGNPLNRRVEVRVR
ncbi:MAG: OmpA family protein, partial [Actinomycetota bacterium]|nr:OmpA family protein [Actinomycetota bacterium]